jgi:hypothetical protein
LLSIGSTLGFEETLGVGLDEAITGVDEAIFGCEEVGCEETGCEEVGCEETGFEEVGCEETDCEEECPQSQDATDVRHASAGTDAIGAIEANMATAIRPDANFLSPLDPFINKSPFKTERLF